jgi:hypothetical protein
LLVSLRSVSMPITAADTITLAIEHTKQQLFKPFRIGQWTKLAFVGLLAGELGSGGFNRSTFNFPHHPPTEIPGFSGIDPALLAALIAFAVGAAFAIGIIFMYISSVMRFILFDSIIAKECHIRSGWSRRMTPGWRYFVWKLLFALAILIILGVLVGVPLIFAFVAGWLNQPQGHMPILVLGGIFIFFVLMVVVISAAVIAVVTKDFVIPQMALENIGAIEGWCRLWPMLKIEKGAYAAYIGMKIVLAIVGGIMVGIAALILGIIVAVPTIGLSIFAVLAGKNAGLTWNAYTITLAIVAGVIVLGIFFYLISLISVPLIVFFPAYSIYFFADRYAPLKAALYPALPASFAPPPPPLPA